ncbi:hypothetical protein HMSSN139_18530 [Paenibacillus sp. HMSSN-139]|nr:hypothetical protein HMSSN139_18530 [Paenibacillus sp. HMSSN-139]
MARFKRNIPLHLMMLPGVILVMVYAYGPMFGLVMAFQNFSPSKGFLHSDWVGLDNFRYILSIPTISEVIRNTLVISILKIVLGIVVPVVVTLMLNELRLRRLKRGIQTIIYFPHFLSWIILAGIFIDILSPSEGVVNKIITVFGFNRLFSRGSNLVSDQHDSDRYVEGIRLRHHRLSGRFVGHQSDALRGCPNGRRGALEANVAHYPSRTDADDHADVRAGSRKHS